MPQYFWRKDNFLDKHFMCLKKDLEGKMLIFFGKIIEILPIVPRALGRQLYSLARWYSKIHHYKDAASDPCTVV